MKMSIRIGIYLLLLLLLYGRSLFSQEDKDLIQFSGVIVEIDSLKPIPFTKIIIKASGRGTLADYYGYFSFVAHQKDTIVFSALGYKKAQYIIPDTLAGNKYSLIQILRFDTILLNEAVIFPWPTREQFKEVFFNMKVPEDDLARAKKNMDREASNNTKVVYIGRGNTPPTTYLTLLHGRNL
jgi:hypothetical protein